MKRIFKTLAALIVSGYIICSPQVMAFTKKFKLCNQAKSKEECSAGKHWATNTFFCEWKSHRVGDIRYESCNILDIDPDNECSRVPIISSGSYNSIDKNNCERTNIAGPAGTYYKCYYKDGIDMLHIATECFAILK